MNKKIFGAAALTLVASAAVAQETYESAQIASTDLNGTARYVGMGGAMEALGADISTMGTNPAGVGLLRRSWAGLSGGLSVTKSGDVHRTNADLNQIGFVYSSQSGENSHFNFGFNYSKSRNFNYLGKVVNSLSNASVNKLVAMKMGSVKLNEQGRKDWKKDNDDRYNLNTELDYDTYQCTNYERSYYDDQGTYTDGYYEATGYESTKNDNGYISNFDFNLSGSVNDRIYLGLTFGLKDVRYSTRTLYGESFDLPGSKIHSYGYSDDRRITGSGLDFKFGAVFRPIEESNFRFGVYIHTPTWYNLRCSSRLAAESTYTDGINPNPYVSDISYEYRVVTPWKFGVSVGHTFAKMVAVGVTYEYADYSSIKNQIKVREDYYGGYSNGYYGYSNNYDNDTEMNRNTDRTLKGVHLVKVGMEIRPVPIFAIRLGYNYQSASYNDDGSKDYSIDSSYSNGAYYSTYDYTNWKSTNRMTCGFGINLSKNCTLDISYQYSVQEGTYHPFQSVSNLTCYSVASDGSAVNPRSESVFGTPTDIKVSRHQLNCTLGYRF